MKPSLLLTFDDQHVDSWFDVLPMFAMYNARATFYLNGLDTLTPQQIDKAHKIQDAGHSIGCHGWRHRGADQYIQEHNSQKYWDDEIQPCLDWYETNDFKTANFAYPNNRYDDCTNALLWDRFDRFRTGIGRVDRTNISLLEPILMDLADLPKQRMMPGAHIDTIVDSTPHMPWPLASWAQVFDWLVEREQYMTTYGHNINTAHQGHSTEPDYLEQVLKLAMDKGVACLGMDDLPAVVR